MRNIVIVAGLLLFAGLSFAAASSEEADRIFEKKGAFTVSDGKSIYEQNCAGCHMPEGQGARGAGMYPALASNGKVEDPSYTAYVIMYGLRGMPSFEPDLGDEQIAAAANHLSVSFGNKGKEKVSVEDVRSIRPEKPVQYIEW